MWMPTHIQLTVQRARGLLVKGKHGTNDCFVVMSLGKEKYQTSVKEKSPPDVEWREECELTIPSQGNTAEIKLQVLHRNFLGVDEFLGQTTIPLSDYDVYERPKNRWYQLHSKPDKKDTKRRGELEVRLGFIVKASPAEPRPEEAKRGSLLSLPKVSGSLGGSLTSLGHKKKSLKKLAAAVGHKVAKAGRRRGSSSHGGSEAGSDVGSDLGWDDNASSNADPGVISEGEEDEFGFDEEHRPAAGTPDLRTRVLQKPLVDETPLSSLSSSVQSGLSDAPHAAISERTAEAALRPEVVSVPSPLAADDAVSEKSSSARPGSARSSGRYRPDPEPSEETGRPPLPPPQPAPRAQQAADDVAKPEGSPAQPPARAQPAETNPFEDSNNPFEESAASPFEEKDPVSEIGSAVTPPKFQDVAVNEDASESKKDKGGKEPERKRDKLERMIKKSPQIFRGLSGKEADAAKNGHESPELENATRPVSEKASLSARPGSARSSGRYRPDPEPSEDTGRPPLPPPQPAPRAQQASDDVAKPEASPAQPAPRAQKTDGDVTKPEARPAQPAPRAQKAETNPFEEAGKNPFEEPAANPFEEPGANPFSEEDSVSEEGVAAAVPGPGKANVQSPKENVMESPKVKPAKDQRKRDKLEKMMSPLKKTPQIFRHLAAKKEDNLADPAEKVRRQETLPRSDSVPLLPLSDWPGSRVVEGGNERQPEAARPPREATRPFDGMPRERLVELVTELQREVRRATDELKKSRAQTVDLEEYLDALLLRVMESHPELLQMPPRPAAAASPAMAGAKYVGRGC